MRRPTQFILLVLPMFLLAACGGGGAGNTEDPEPSLITVSGTLLNPDGSAASGLPVVVAGRATTTDTSGAFQVDDVETPYEVTVYHSAFNTVIAFQGLTVEEPALVIYGTTSSEDRGNSVTFRASGFDPAPPAPPPGHSNWDNSVCSGPVRFDNCGGRGNPRPVATSRSPKWHGPVSTPARILAVQGTVHDSQTTVFTSYSRLATHHMTFVDGVDTSYTLDYAPVSTGRIEGTTLTPAGYVVTYRGLGLTQGDEDWGQISYLQSNPAAPIQPDFDLATPDNGNFYYYIKVEAEQGEAWISTRVPVASPEATDITVEVPAPPQPLQPNADQVGVTQNTLFEWTGMEDAVYTLNVVSLVPGAPLYLITTADTEARLPDLSAIGVSLPNAVDYRWGVNAVAPVASMDDLATGMALNSSRGTEARSGMRNFTTAP